MLAPIVTASNSRSTRICSASASSSVLSIEAKEGLTHVICGKRKRETEHVGIGSKHLKPSSAQEHLDLNVASFGRYDLIEGVLVEHEMPDRTHDIAVLYMLYRFLLGTAISFGFQAFCSSTVKVPEQGEDETNFSNSEGRQTQVLPDFAIGMISSDSQENVIFPLGSAPNLVLEVTSSNLENDVSTKKRRYARTKVDWYVIVDRGAEPSVHLGVLRKGRYKFRTYRKGEHFRCPFVGIVLVDDLLRPQEPAEKLRMRIAGQRENLRIERERRLEAEQALQEALEEAEHERRRNCSKIAAMKERLRKYEENVSEDDVS